MRIIYTLFIALANNIDNISVRIAYSIRGIKIPMSKNLYISFITFIFASLAALSGQVVSQTLNSRISSYLSMILLIGIGIWIIIEPYRNKKNKEEEVIVNEDISIQDIMKNPEKADVNNSKDIDYKEATLLGVALSMDTLGGGLSAGMIGVNPIFVGFFSALVSFIALWVGNYVAKIFSKWNIGEKAPIIAGVLLILIGIKQII
ncbi:sporulation membrane protein YtaF [Clostridium sp. YIM B02565]|uniref:Sporulation membrane protein YtaF n=2 Tax=Clostridium paridis TaxID=2803863 RepID=A0A937FHP2_9CLOT|nr:sporulation membrane protein YtaF [Clostridium paridis]